MLRLQVGHKFVFASPRQMSNSETTIATVIGPRTIPDAPNAARPPITGEKNQECVEAGKKVVSQQWQPFELLGRDLGHRAFVVNECY
jgi:hypothetical protein